jgi:hypothetical protein
MKPSPVGEGVRQSLTDEVSSLQKSTPTEVRALPYLYMSPYNPKQPQKYKSNYPPTHRIDTIENTIYSSTKSGNTKYLKCV